MASALGGGVPLAIASANLDHLHHFAAGGLDLPPDQTVDGVRWRTLLDGVPLLRAVERTARRPVELHTGSELLPEALRLGAEVGARVVLVGGGPVLRERWPAALAEQYPGLVDAGTREVAWAWLDRAGSGEQLARWVADRRADVVVVSLGKPRQERWLRDHGARTGGRLLLAVGSAPEYVAGTAYRAPDWARRHGLEWAVRLAREPRRLWRRYLLDDARVWLGLRRRLRTTPPA
ncbi:hypothetical protein GCM10022197_13620 [Microlunatus spumicola]|uniref:N-acetylglucosaminyldiphosphoundecaprenol N-acetyl-beta-D-mannosaminyltransferase n=2 Tax=Microlunatus spumicola TaxID=81499 RepID=A0ABP6X0I5_9ACTN